MLPLGRDSKVLALPPNAVGGATPFAFSVSWAHPATGAARRTVLAAASAEERDAWVACLQFAAQRCATLALAAAGGSGGAVAAASAAAADTTVRAVLSREVPSTNIFKRNSPEWVPETVALCGSVVVTYAAAAGAAAPSAAAAFGASAAAAGAGAAAAATGGGDTAPGRTGRKSVFGLFGSGRAGSSRNIAALALAGGESDASAAAAAAAVAVSGSSDPGSDAAQPKPTTITLLGASTTVSRGDGPGLVHVVGKVDKLALKAGSTKVCNEWIDALGRSLEVLKTSGMHAPEQTRGRSASLSNRINQWESKKVAGIPNTASSPNVKK